MDRTQNQYRDQHDGSGRTYSPGAQKLLLTDRDMSFRNPGEAVSKMGNDKISRCKWSETSPRSSSGNSLRTCGKAEITGDSAWTQKLFISYLIQINPVIQGPRRLEIFNHPLPQSLRDLM
jgi:hypothetical protein